MYREHWQERTTNPEAVSYFSRVNAHAKEEAAATGRYVTVEYGDDAPNSRGLIGITYGPSGEVVLLGSVLPDQIAAQRRIVGLANAALDAGLKP